MYYTQFAWKWFMIPKLPNKKIDFTEKYLFKSGHFRRYLLIWKKKQYFRSCGIYPLPPIIFTKTYNFSKVYDFLKRTCTSYVQTIVFSPKKYMNNELEFVIKPLKSVIFKTQAHWPRVYTCLFERYCKLQLYALVVI